MSHVLLLTDFPNIASHIDTVHMILYVQLFHDKILFSLVKQSTTCFVCTPQEI